MFLVGDATAAEIGIQITETKLFFRDAANPNKFYFVGKFGTSMFKLIETLGNNTWQPQWGLKAS